MFASNRNVGACPDGILDILFGETVPEDTLCISVPRDQSRTLQKSVSRSLKADGWHSVPGEGNTMRFQRGQAKTDIVGFPSADGSAIFVFLTDAG